MIFINLLFSYSVILMEEHKTGLLSVNPGLIIWTIVIFVLLLLILKKVAWGPLIKALHSRENTIKTALENADKINKEAAELMEKNKKEMAEASAKSLALINEAKETAQKVREDIIAKAGEESHKLIDEAKEQITRQKEAALQELKGEISNIAIKAAEKILNENLDETRQKKIVDDFLTKIPEN